MGTSLVVTAFLIVFAVGVSYWCFWSYERRAKKEGIPIDHPAAKVSKRSRRNYLMVFPSMAATLGLVSLLPASGNTQLVVAGAICAGLMGLYFVMEGQVERDEKVLIKEYESRAKAAKND